MSEDEKLPAIIERHKFNVDDFYRLAETHFLHEEERVELVEGDLVHMAPIGSRHAACVKRINRLLNRLLVNSISSGYIVLGIQDPIQVDQHNVLQPDISILRGPLENFEYRHPNPEEILLIIEVCDSTLAYDRDVKIPIYARSGVQEVWLVSIEEECVFVYLTPFANGYKEIQKDRDTDEINPTAFPEICFPAKQVFE